MNSTPHTPGPWSTECNLPFGHQPRIESAAKLIALVGNAETSCQDEWEANARLIAAAPDMYEALDRLLNWPGKVGGWRGEDIAFARAALAKARGAS